LDSYAKTGNGQKEKLRPIERFPGSAIQSCKKSQSVLFREQRRGRRWTRCNWERTRLSRSIVRFTFRILSFLEVALINRFRVASKWHSSLIQHPSKNNLERKFVECQDKSPSSILNEKKGRLEN